MYIHTWNPNYLPNIQTWASFYSLYRFHSCLFACLFILWHLLPFLFFLPFVFLPFFYSRLVISALADLSSKGKKVTPNFVPYRDSTLTWLLKVTSLPSDVTTLWRLYSLTSLPLLWRHYSSFSSDVTTSSLTSLTLLWRHHSSDVTTPLMSVTSSDVTTPPLTSLPLLWRYYPSFDVSTLWHHYPFFDVTTLPLTSLTSSDVTTPPLTSLPLLWRHHSSSDATTPSLTSLPLLWRHYPSSDVITPPLTSLPLL